MLLTQAITAVKAVLDELGLADHPTLLVLNKADQVPDRSFLDVLKAHHDESIVISITGNGLKTLEVVADELPYPVVIDPKLSEFDQLFDDDQKKREATSTERRTAESTVTAGV